MDGRNRSDVARGADVSVVLKEDQPTGKQTRGIVQDLLTKSPFHPHGIKVRLRGGKVGRVQVIHSAGHSSRRPYENRTKPRCLLGFHGEKVPWFLVGSHRVVAGGR